MRTNLDVVKRFNDGLVCETRHLKSTGDKLYSYFTCIAQREGNVVYINNTKYSRTTTNHQNLVKSVCKNCVILKAYIPIGIPYLNCIIRNEIQSN